MCSLVTFFKMSSFSISPTYEQTYTIIVEEDEPEKKEMTSSTTSTDTVTSTVSTSLPTSTVRAPMRNGIPDMSVSITDSCIEDFY